MGTLLFLGYALPFFIVCICCIIILIKGLEKYDDNTLILAVALTVSMGVIPILNIAVAIETIKVIVYKEY